MKVYVVHIYEPDGSLYDYYVYQQLDPALQQAAYDVVQSRWASADSAFVEVEVARVLTAVQVEPGVGRHHVSCYAWRAHVDEIEAQTEAQP
jgi:hypothetical protein